MRRSRTSDARVVKLLGQTTVCYRCEGGCTESMQYICDIGLNRENIPAMCSGSFSSPTAARELHSAVVFHGRAKRTNLTAWTAGRSAVKCAAPGPSSRCSQVYIPTSPLFTLLCEDGWIVSRRLYACHSLWTVLDMRPMRWSRLGLIPILAMNAMVRGTIPQDFCSSATVASTLLSTPSMVSLGQL